MIIHFKRKNYTKLHSMKIGEENIYAYAQPLVRLFLHPTDNASFSVYRSMTDQQSAQYELTVDMLTGEILDDIIQDYH